MQQTKKPRVVILGGGFAGVYTGMQLEKLLRGHDDFDIVMVNRENYTVFQPMLPEVISGSLGPLDVVNPINRLMPRTQLYCRDVVSIDLERRQIVLSQGLRPQAAVLDYDYLVLALGNVTDFRGMAGLHEHAMPFKNLADALQLRNHLIHILTEADVETDPELCKQMLTFVIAGGGFSGVEVAAELNDFVRYAAKNFPRIDPELIQVILVHSGERILDKEFGPELSLYAQDILQKRKVEFLFKSRLKAATRDVAILADGRRIATRTLVSTVPSSPNPLIDVLPLPKERGRIKTDRFLKVEGTTNVWALGDCASIPSPTGHGVCPPTAQFAVRQGTTAGGNVVAALRGSAPKEFQFKELGKMAALGHHRAVIEMFGKIKVSGFLAWIMWRAIYWMKLPGLDRKVRVGFSWFLDLLLPPDIVQMKINSTRAMMHAHFEAGDIVFRKGDLGDVLYMILAGEAEVLEMENDVERVVARLKAGEYFGEFALLHDKPRGATVRCVTAMDVISMHKADFKDLIATLPDMRSEIGAVSDRRFEELSSCSEITAVESAEARSIVP